MKLIEYFRHRIGYAVRMARIALLGFTIGIATSASAAINYLVITPSVGGPNGYETRLSVSIAAACPAGYYIHRFGMNDVNGALSGNTYDGVIITGGLLHSAISSWKICVVGVPSTLNISPAERIYAGSGSTIVAAFALSASNSPQVLNGWVSPNDTNARGFSPTYNSGVGILLPDGFMLVLSGINGAYTEYGYVAGIHGLSFSATYMSWWGIVMPGGGGGNGAAYMQYFYGAASGGNINATVPFGFECYNGVGPCYGYVVGY